MTGRGYREGKPKVFGLGGRAFLGWLRRAPKKKIHTGIFSPAFSPPPRSVYEDLVAKGVIVPAQEVPPPTVPMDYSWARVGAMYAPDSVSKRDFGAKVVGFELICLEPLETRPTLVVRAAM